MGVGQRSLALVEGTVWDGSRAAMGVSCCGACQLTGNDAAALHDRRERVQVPGSPRVNVTTV